MIRIKPSKRNTNKHTEAGMELLENSINEVGVIESISVTKQGTIISGHARKEKFDKKGFVPKEIILAENEYPVIVRNDIEDNTDTYYKAQILANTTAHQNYNLDAEEIEVIAEEYDLDLEELGIEVEDVNLNGPIETQNKKGALEERFLIPPFSVLDSKLGRWQNRKRWWLNKGIKSELGRDDLDLFPPSAQGSKFYDIKNELRDKGLPHSTQDVVVEMRNRGYSMFGNGDGSISIFDPVLCELSYRWFNVDGGAILDPFAGGSVRGIVASLLGYKYLGNDLREEQILANRKNAEEVLSEEHSQPVWTIGDSKNIDKLAKGYEADMVFSCPPYADLEVYSDNPDDISNMDYEDFIKAYKEIIHKSCSLLKDDRFAVFVVGDVRDKKGLYRNFVSDTISCFLSAGLHLYNEMILVNIAGSLAMRLNSQFQKNRKVGKQHQNVLVFYKGDPKNIRNNFKELDLSYLNEETESEYLEEQL